MKKLPQTKATNSKKVNASDLLQKKPDAELAANCQYHRIGEVSLCKTDYRARKRSPTQIVLDATDGFIPLWAEDQVLRWTFNSPSLEVFANPGMIEDRVRELWDKAVMAWGDSAPIRFKENSDNSDFEIVVESRNDCSPQGCTLAMAFFPDSGRHQLLIYPKMFEQDDKEQVDTLTHEIGHIFGLRHFFAPENETPWPSEVFGKHKPFSIMNYGDKSELTKDDKRDLKLLYQGAWSGSLKKVNGTPIKLVRPFSSLRD